MITKVIKLDINKNLYEKIKAKQGDTKSRFLLFQLLDGSMPFNLENRSVRAYMLKPDSTEVFNDLIINNRNTGHCTLELTNQVLAVAGIVKIELMIIENDKKITSSIFELQVDKSINSENSIVSTNEFNALLNGLASLSEYDNYKEKAKKVPELEENIQELGSQLEHKANKNEVIKRGYGTLNDFDEDTRRLIQGLSDGEINAVLGDGNVAYNNLNADIRNIIKDIQLTVFDYKEMNLEVQNSVVIDGIYTKTGESDSYRSVILNCNQGELYAISGCAYNIHTSLISYFKDDTYVSSVLNGTLSADSPHYNSTVYKDIKIQIPTGVNKMVVLGIIDLQLPIVKKLNNSIPKKNGNEINELIDNTRFYDGVDGLLSTGFIGVGSGEISLDKGSQYRTLTIDCSEGDVFRVSGCAYNTYTSFITLTSGIEYRQHLYQGTLQPNSSIYNSERFNNIIITIPSGVNKIHIFGIDGVALPVAEKLVNGKIREKFDNINEEIKFNSKWRGKKIVWFGTSIPAGGYIGLNNKLSYPMLVGEILGANVVNEAVGSSALCCRRPEQVSEKNPYGFNRSFEQCSRSLGNSIEEMQWIIDNWDSDIWTHGKLTEAPSEELKQEILSFSYENKLIKKHLGENRADLYVFNHGFNDNYIYENQQQQPPEGQPENRLYYQGVFNHLVGLILADNPKARIIIIGEYENQKYPWIQKMQEESSRHWSFPLFRAWEIYGWSQNKIKVRGQWVNGEWKEDGIEREMTVLDRWLPDTVHPHSDLTNECNEFIANNISTWIKNNISII